jgi:Spy/CpxP family protein refolding chaperone
MKSIRKLLWPTLLAAGAVLTAGAGLSVASAADAAAAPGAAGAPGAHDWHHHRGPWRLLGKLNLSADQKQQVKDIMTAARPQMQSLHEQMHAQHAELRAQIFKVLTPEQQTQLAALEAQRGAGKQ